MPAMPIHAVPPEASTAAAFLRLPVVMRITGLGRSTIYRLVADHRFPCPVRLGCRAIGWRRLDIEAWSAERPSAGTVKPASSRA
jgi:prophage regulatory protein